MQSHFIFKSIVGSFGTEASATTQYFFNILYWFEEKEGRPPTKGQRHKVFEESFDPKECFSNKFVFQKLEYMHKNPISKKWQLVMGLAYRGVCPFSTFKLQLLQGKTPGRTELALSIHHINDPVQNHHKDPTFQEIPIQEHLVHFRSGYHLILIQVRGHQYFLLR